MARDSQPTITEWRIHHTTAGGHSVDRKQFGDFLRSDQGQSMIARAAQAHTPRPGGTAEVNQAGIFTPSLM